MMFYVWTLWGPCLRKQTRVVAQVDVSEPPLKFGLREAFVLVGRRCRKLHRTVVCNCCRMVPAVRSRIKRETTKNETYDNSGISTLMPFSLIVQYTVYSTHPRHHPHPHPHPHHHHHHHSNYSPHSNVFALVGFHHIVLWICLINALLLKSLFTCLKDLLQRMSSLLVSICKRSIRMQAACSHHRLVSPALPQALLLCLESRTKPGHHRSSHSESAALRSFLETSLLARSPLIAQLTIAPWSLQESGHFCSESNHFVQDLVHHQHLCAVRIGCFQTQNIREHIYSMSNVCRSNWFKLQQIWRKPQKWLSWGPNTPPSKQTPQHLAAGALGPKNHLNMKQTKSHRVFVLTFRSFNSTFSYISIKASPCVLVTYTIDYNHV